MEERRLKEEEDFSASRWRRKGSAWRRRRESWRKTGGWLRRCRDSRRKRERGGWFVYGPVHKGVSESCSESCFGSWFDPSWTGPIRPFPYLKAYFTLLWAQSSFKSGFWNAKKGCTLDRAPPRKRDFEEFLWTQSSFRMWFVHVHFFNCVLTAMHRSKAWFWGLVHSQSSFRISDSSMCITIYGNNALKPCMGQ